MNPAPLKRAEAIVPLSRDHHHGLLFAWKLKQGIRYGVAPERMAPYVAYFWQEHLTPHFREEEALLFCHAPESDLVQQALREHMEICRLADAGATAAETALLQQLADLVNNHIRFEERVLFPFLEKNLSAETLRETGAALDTVHHVADDTWADVFWKKPEA